MGREEEMGILIELVSVRAGASSKGWRTTASLRVGRRACAGAGWEPPGTREHQPGFLRGHAVRNLPLHPGSPAGLPSCSSPHGLPSPLHPILAGCPCLPATATASLRNPLRKPSGFVGKGVELGVGTTCSSLPGRWCHLSPVPFVRSPAVFACSVRQRQHPQASFGCVCRFRSLTASPCSLKRGPETLWYLHPRRRSNLALQSPEQPALTGPASSRVLDWRPPCISSKSGALYPFKGQRTCRSHPSWDMTWMSVSRGQHSSTLAPSPPLDRHPRGTPQSRAACPPASASGRGLEKSPPGCQNSLGGILVSLVWFDPNQLVPCHSKLEVHSGRNPSPTKQPAQVKGVQQWGHSRVPIFLPLDRTPFHRST